MAEPTREQLLALMHTDERQLCESKDAPAAQCEEIFDFYRMQWKQNHPDSPTERQRYQPPPENLHAMEKEHRRSKQEQMRRQLQDLGIEPKSPVEIAREAIKDVVPKESAQDVFERELREMQQRFATPPNLSDLHDQAKQSFDEWASKSPIDLERELVGKPHSDTEFPDRHISISPRATQFDEAEHPIRRWFLAAAGAIAVWILYAKIDVPLWLALITMATLLLAAWVWPWVDKEKKRRTWFWVLIVLYGLGAAVFLAIRASALPKGSTAAQSNSISTSSPTQTQSIQPSPSDTPNLSPSPTPQSTMTPTPVLFPNKLGALQCSVSEYDEGYKLMQGAVCVAKHQHTGQEYSGGTDYQGMVQISVPYGFYIVMVKADGYITEVGSVKVDREIVDFGATLKKVRR